MPNIFKTSVLPLGIHGLPHGITGSRLDGTSSCSQGKHYMGSPEDEAGTQDFHPQEVWTVLPQPLALGTGVFKYGITTAVQVKASPWNRKKLTNLRFEYNGSLFIIFHME